jgi:hypothetical protein
MVMRRSSGQAEWGKNEEFGVILVFLRQKMGEKPNSPLSIKQNQLLRQCSTHSVGLALDK